MECKSTPTKLNLNDDDQINYEFSWFKFVVLWQHWQNISNKISPYLSNVNINNNYCLWMFEVKSENFMLNSAERFFAITDI